MRKISFRNTVVSSVAAGLISCASATALSAESSVSEVKIWLNDLGLYVGPPSPSLDETTLEALATVFGENKALDADELTAERIAKLKKIHDGAERHLGIGKQFSWSSVKLTVNNYNNKRSPRLINDELVSQIFDRECVGTDYGDGRGESDCSNGNVGSAVETTKLIKLGSYVRINFEFWVQPNLDVQPVRMYTERGPFTSDPFHSHLIMFELERTRSIKNHVYDLDVDSVRGVTFLDKNCIKPEQFGGWHTFEFDLLYSSKEDGALTVRCDGKAIYVKDNFNSALNPFCYEANGCAPKYEQLYSEPMRLELGAQMRGNGWTAEERGLPVFNKIQSDGIMIRYRDLSVKYK